MIVQEYEREYDVVVVGGGLSGVCCAVAAARNGAKTLIVDENGYLGGALTSCSVGPMMTFFAGEKQVIKGIGEEIVARMKEKGYSPGHILDSTNYISYVTPFQAEGLKIVLDEIVIEAGCDILFHTTLVSALKYKNKIAKAVVNNKSGLQQIKAKVFVDATGDGDLAYLVNVPCQLGRESDGAMQPMTMNLKLYNVDKEKIRKHILDNLDKYPRINRDANILKIVDYLSIIGFEEEFKQAKEQGELHIPREDILFFETGNPGEFIINTTRIIEKNGVDANDITAAEIEGRKQCEELYRFMVKKIVGFENAKIGLTGPSIGKRGTRQIEGVYKLTGEDIINETSFDDVIGHSGYPIDIHNPKGEGTLSLIKGVSEEKLNEDFDKSVFEHYYQLPYKIMITKKVDNLLVTGRCVSATFEAQAAIRTTPTMTVLGQAAGVAAAMAVESEDVHEINISKLQQRLKEQGSFIEV